MGNTRSKTKLRFLINSWEKSDPEGLQYKTYTNLKKAIVIHRLNGHYFIESGSATIGPMTKKQLLLISNRNSLEKIRTTHAINQSKRELDSSMTRPSMQGDVCSERLTIHSNSTMLSKLPIDGSINISYKDNTISKNNISPLSSKSNDTIKQSNELYENDFIKTYDSKAYLELKSSRKNLNSRDDSKDNSTIAPTQSITYTAYGRNMMPYQNRIINPNRPNIPVNLKKILKNKSKAPVKTTPVIEAFKSKYPLNNNLNNQCYDLSQKETIMDNTLAKIDELPITSHLMKQLHPKHDTSYIKHRNSLIRGDSNIRKLSTDEPVNGWNSGCNNTVGLSELIKNERYCFSALADFNNIEWSRIKTIVKRLQNGFLQRYKCNVIMSENQTVYRGNMYYMVRIEGPDLFSVIKCRNSLPSTLRKSLIVTNTNPDHVEKKMRDKFSSRLPDNIKPSFRDHYRGDIRI